MLSRVMIALSAAKRLSMSGPSTTATVFIMAAAIMMGMMATIDPER